MHVVTTVHVCKYYEHIIMVMVIRSFVLVRGQYLPRACHTGGFHILFSFSLVYVIRPRFS